MRHINDRKEYESIVNEIAETFEKQLKSGTALEVALGIIANHDVINGDPTVIHGITLWGESWEIKGSNETLCPYDIVRLSQQQDIEYFDRPDYLAARLLAKDIHTAHTKASAQ